MKIYAIIIALFAMLAICTYGDISQGDYNLLLKQNQALAEKVESLTRNCQDLKAKLAEAEKEAALAQSKIYAAEKTARSQTFALMRENRNLKRAIDNSGKKADLDLLVLVDKTTDIDAVDSAKIEIEKEAAPKKKHAAKNSSQEQMKALQDKAQAVHELPLSESEKQKQKESGNSFWKEMFPF
ncbi:MAG: hypothetical protein SPI34_05455 [Opitutales bacterium]|nr:hypothetical protein [Opitutales bacterium]